MHSSPRCVRLDRNPSVFGARAMADIIRFPRRVAASAPEIDEGAPLMSAIAAGYLRSIGQLERILAELEGAERSLMAAAFARSSPQGALNEQARIIEVAIDRARAELNDLRRIEGRLFRTSDRIS